MSNAVSALGGASYEGYVSVRELDLMGMITLRGDFKDKTVQSAVKSLTGAALPKQRQIVGGAEGFAVAWMSPDELLILCPYGDVDAHVAALNKALGTSHALVVNVSDARAMFEIKGALAREVIAKIAPVDMATFTIGEIRRTRVAQVAAAFWMSDDETVNLVCFRSVGQYVFDLLKASSHKGFEVGYF